jgi:hypothetical protein
MPSADMTRELVQIRDVTQSGRPFGVRAKSLQIEHDFAPGICSVARSQEFYGPAQDKVVLADVTWMAEILG